MLALANPIDAQRPNEDVLTQLVLSIQAIIAEIAGEAHALATLHGALALTHGFILLELNNQLRRGGDLSADFDQAITLTFAAGKPFTQIDTHLPWLKT